MLIIGLTGSIGMGKSTAAKRFRHNGIAVCDADAEVHKLYAAGGAAVAPIETAFPGTTTATAGVDRQKLAAQLLADPAGFKRLEAIVHPLVRAAEQAFLRQAKADGHWAAVLEIPLLFEGGGDNAVDATVVVSAPAEMQRARVMARPGMTADWLDMMRAGFRGVAARSAAGIIPQAVAGIDAPDRRRQIHDAFADPGVGNRRVPDFPYTIAATTSLRRRP